MCLSSFPAISFHASKSRPSLDRNPRNCRASRGLGTRDKSARSAWELVCPVVVSARVGLYLSGDSFKNDSNGHTCTGDTTSWNNQRRHSQVFVSLRRILRLDVTTPTGPQDGREFRPYDNRPHFVLKKAHLDPEFAFRFNVSSFSCNVSLENVSNSLVHVATLLDFFNTILFD